MDIKMIRRSFIALLFFFALSHAGYSVPNNYQTSSVPSPTTESNYDTYASDSDTSSVPSYSIDAATSASPSYPSGSTSSSYSSGSTTSSGSSSSSGSSYASDYASTSYGSSSSSSSGSSSSSTVSSTVLPKKPSPASGQSFPTTNSYTSTTGLPYDFFTGISLRQLDIVRQQSPIVDQQAAQSVNLDVTRGTEVFGSIANYILTLWFPEDAKKIGLPFNSNGTDGGGQLKSTETFFQSGEAQLLSSRYGRTIGALLGHVLNFDAMGYARVEDDYVYRTYLDIRANAKNSADAISIFLHDTIQQTGALDYILGSNFTDEIHSAYKSVFRFINWRSATEFDLYQRKVLSRFEGPENDACAAIEPLDLTPAEQNYTMMSNGSAAMMGMMQYGTYSNGTQAKTGPVNPDGSPKAKHSMGRQFSDYAPAGQNFHPMGGQYGATQTSTMTNGLLFSQPAPAPGATPLFPQPYSATAGQNVDSFSGIGFSQLAVGLEAWKNVTKAAAAASGVPEADGAKAYGKLAYYILLLWHSEYSAITSYQSPDDIWTNVTLDAGFASTSKDFDNQIIGLTQNQPAMTVRLIDKIAFSYYQDSRARGQAWYTLPFFAWLNDAQMEAVKFYLGDALSDEAYSALESIFNFISLKTYQTYHSYEKGYRVRPFADDWEMIGGSLGNALGLGGGLGGLGLGR